MTIEDKAKRYDEAIEKAKEYFNSPRTCFDIEQLCNVFPELKESIDERVKKVIKQVLSESTTEKDECYLDNGVTQQEVFAWLEKQSKASKVEQAMREVKEKAEVFTEAHKGETSEEILAQMRGEQKPAENKGMNLVEEDMTPFQKKVFCIIDTTIEEEQGLKQVCDELLRLAHDEIKQKPVIEMKSAEESLGISSDTYNKIVDECIYGEQKPAEIVKWSPQEENCICQLESLVKEQWRQAEKVHNSVNIKKMSELMFFLKTLNPNKKPQRIISAEAKEAMYDKPAWSEEDEKLFNRICDLIHEAAYENCETNEDGKELGEYAKMMRLLKFLKDCIQPKQEWSEEDENILKDIITDVKFEGYNNDMQANSYKKINWLKSLKERYTWKPSDEQMEALDFAADCIVPAEFCFKRNELKGLLEQLQKLKG